LKPVTFPYYRGRSRKGFGICIYLFSQPGVLVGYNGKKKEYDKEAQEYGIGNFHFLYSGDIEHAVPSGATLNAGVRQFETL
jgi:hypothetical protein